MHSKNKKPMTKAEREHVTRIKSMPCGVCNEPGPSEAHEIDQGYWFLSIPLCPDCHRGNFNGIHGQARIWQAAKKTAMSVLNETLGKLQRPSL